MKKKSFKLGVAVREREEAWSARERMCRILASIQMEIKRRKREKMLHVRLWV